MEIGITDTNIRIQIICFMVATYNEQAKKKWGRQQAYEIKKYINLFSVKVAQFFCADIALKRSKLI